MQIRSNYNINFGSRHLYSAVLNGRGIFNIKTKTPVFISELDITDVNRLREIYPEWKSTKYGADIINTFLQDFTQPHSSLYFEKKFFAVETPKGAIKAIAIAQDATKYNWHLNMLQSQREILKNKSLTGAGSCILYLITKLADLSGKEVASLHATDQSIKFYNRFGFEKVFNDNFRCVLPKSKFSDLEKMMEQKYSIKPITENINA